MRPATYLPQIFEVLLLPLSILQSRALASYEFIAFRASPTFLPPYGLEDARDLPGCEGLEDVNFVEVYGHVFLVGVDVGVGGGGAEGEERREGDGGGEVG